MTHYVTSLSQPPRPVAEMPPSGADSLSVASDSAQFPAYLPTAQSQALAQTSLSWWQWARQPAENFKKSNIKH